MWVIFKNVFLPKKLRKKLDPKLMKVIFVRYNSISKAYQLWDPIEKQIIICCDVLFWEEDFPHLINNMHECTELFSYVCKKMLKDKASNNVRSDATIGARS